MSEREGYPEHEKLKDRLEEFLVIKNFIYEMRINVCENVILEYIGIDIKNFHDEKEEMSEKYIGLKAPK